MTDEERPRNPTEILAYQQTRRAKRYRRELLAIRDQLDAIADRIEQLTNER